MLQLNQSKIVASVEHKLATGVVLAEEGLALVTTYENGELRVKPSTGVSGEKFVGIALSAMAAVTVAPMVQELVVPSEAPYEVHLARAPITDTEISVKGLTKSTSTSAEASKFALKDNVVTVYEDLKGKAIQVTYAYSPTVAELTQFQGEPSPGQHVTTALGQTGVITAGAVFTSAFDITCDWTPNAQGVIDVYLGANGKFTTKTTGTKIDAIVTHLPQVGMPFLGLQFHI